MQQARLCGGLIIAALLFSLISSLLINSEVENWAQFGPFGRNPDDRFHDYSAFKNASAYWNFISSILISPTVTIERISRTRYFVITVHLPYFDEKLSEVFLSVTVYKAMKVHPQANRSGFRYADKRNPISIPVNHRFDDPNKDHFIALPKASHNKQDKVTEFEYHAYFDLPQIQFIEAKAALSIHSVCYPQDLKAYRDEIRNAQTPENEQNNNGNARADNTSLNKQHWATSTFKV